MSAPRAPRHLHAVPSGHPVRATPSRPPGPDPARLAWLLARTWAEVRAGRRPLAQLHPLVTSTVRRRLTVLLLRDPRPRGWPPATVRRVVASQPHDGACEAVVLLEEGQRITALAIRLERRPGIWKAVDLAAPEHGLPALAAPPRRPAPPPDAFDLTASSGPSTGCVTAPPDAALRRRGSA